MYGRMAQGNGHLQPSRAMPGRLTGVVEHLGKVVRLQEERLHGLGLFGGEVLLLEHAALHAGSPLVEREVQHRAHVHPLVRGAWGTRNTEREQLGRGAEREREGREKRL